MIEVIFNQPVFKPRYVETAAQYDNSFIRYVIYDSDTELYYVVRQWRGTASDNLSNIYVLSKAMYDTKRNSIYLNPPAIEVNFNNELFPILEASPGRYVERWHKTYMQKVQADTIKYQRIKKLLLKEFESNNYNHPEGALSSLLTEVKKHCRWLQLQEEIQDTRSSY